MTFEITPNEYDFKNATRDLINGLEETIGKIVLSFRPKKFSCRSFVQGKLPSLCDHPELKLFCNFPNFDPSNPGARTPIRQSLVKWPDVEFLFGDDVEHQEIILETLSTVNRALSNVQIFVKVKSNQFSFVASKSSVFVFLFSVIKSIATWFLVVFN